MAKAKKVKKKAPKKRKPTSKKPAPKSKKKTKKVPAKKKSPKKKSSLKSKQVGALPPPIEGTLLGRIDDFFAQVNVIALVLKSSLRVGDAIHIKGHTTDMIETVASMQIDHEAIESGKKGDSVGIKISGVARKRDWVFRLG